MWRPYLGFKGGNNHPSCPGGTLQDLMTPPPTRELSDLSTLTPILQMRTLRLQPGELICPESRKQGEWEPSPAPASFLKVCEAWGVGPGAGGVTSPDSGSQTETGPPPPRSCRS